jgi:transcriptional regulator with XRE-family HTH domain
MARSFPETLSALRRERNISQRRAAADLDISQALLSHYENGAREPGLNFVCRACDYYGVSADYLLCRCDEPEPLKKLASNTENILDSVQGLIDKARNEIKQYSIQEDLK